MFLERAAVAGHKAAAYVLGLLLYTASEAPDVGKHYISQVEGEPPAPPALPIGPLGHLAPAAGWLALDLPDVVLPNVARNVEEEAERIGRMRTPVYSACNA